MHSLRIYILSPAANSILQGAEFEQSAISQGSTYYAPKALGAPPLAPEALRGRPNTYSSQLRLHC